MPNQCKLDKQYATLLISDRVCCDAISSPLFRDFLIGVAEHGPGYELPSSFTLKSQVIPDIKKEVEEYVKNVIRNSIKTGYTLMCKTRFCSNCNSIDDEDGHKVDTFAYTPIGMVCMNPPFYSDFKETMSYIMMLFGTANAVQFIIDNDDGNMDHGSSIKDILTKEYPRIFQTPCATHGVRLLLRKIALVPFVHNTLTVAKWIVAYIFKHKVNVSLRRVHKMKSDVASLFFTLISLLEVESELQALQVSIVTLSSDWEKLLNDMQAFKVAKFIDLAIHCKEFWSRGKMVAQVMKPLLQVLYLVHCDGPTFGYLYEMMEKVEDAVGQRCGSNKVLYQDIWKVLNEVGSDIIHPIHAAAAFLNPIYMCSEKFKKENVEMMDGVYYMVEHLVAVEEKETFMSQIQLYRMKVPHLFTTQAMIMLKTSHPQVWWESCGNHLPVLQKYAIQILSQPCSSTLCKRHELRGNYSEDCAFMLNTMMMERYKSLETQMREPIILDKLGVLDDDPKFQDLWNEDNDWDVDDDDDNLSFPLYGMPEDPTGSWLDWWPEKRIELSK